MTTVVAENTLTSVSVSSSPNDVSVTTNNVSVDVTNSIASIITAGTQGPRGPQGIAGPSGGAAVQIEAGEAIGGHRVVRQDAGLAYYADPADPSDVVGVTLGAGAQGDTLDIAVAGEVEEPSWTWTSGPVYLGANATLTQTPPADAPVLRIGVALSPTRIAVTLDPPVY